MLVFAYTLVNFISLFYKFLTEWLLSGTPYVQKDIAGRIVGGSEATPHSAPFIVSVRVINNQGNQVHNCGGVIISPNNVLSAAHCISTLTTILVAGAHDTQTDAPGTQRRNVLRAIAHELYPGGNVVAPHDICIYVPTTPFVLDTFVNVAALPLSAVHPTGSLQLFGWGSTSSSIFPSMPRFLQTLTKTIIPIQECLNIPRMVGTPLHAQANLCTGPIDSGVDACGGDSGGPLVQGNNPATVWGLVSWGWFPCGRGPSVAVQVSNYLPWIAANRVQG